MTAQWHRPSGKALHGLALHCATVINSSAETSTRVKTRPQPKRNHQTKKNQKEEMREWVVDGSAKGSCPWNGFWWFVHVCRTVELLAERLMALEEFWNSSIYRCYPDAIQDSRVADLRPKELSRSIITQFIDREEVPFWVFPFSRNSVVVDRCWAIPWSSKWTIVNSPPNVNFYFDSTILRPPKKNAKKKS